MPEQDRLWAVADNCRDETASIAKRCGATVIERYQTDRIGKGYALEWALSRMASDPPEVVVVTDADYIAEPGLIATISGLSFSSGRPV